MPCTVRDASLVTIKKRNIALNSYYNGWLSAVNSTYANNSLTSPAATSAEVLAEIHQGCSSCYAVSNNTAKNAGLAYDKNVSLYPNNPSAGGASGLTGSS